MPASSRAGSPQSAGGRPSRSAAVKASWNAARLATGGLRIAGARAAHQDLRGAVSLAEQCAKARDVLVALDQRGFGADPSDEALIETPDRLGDGGAVGVDQEALPKPRIRRIDR